MRKHGSPMSHVPSRLPKKTATFDCVPHMDEINWRDLNRKSYQVKNLKAKIELFGSYEPQKQLLIEDRY